MSNTSRLLAGACCATVVLGLAVPAAAAPIPNQPGTSGLAPLIGTPARPNPVSIETAPQNPWMAPNPYNNIHNDAGMSDSYAGRGPLGRKPKVTSGSERGECASITFNSAGQIVAVCIRTDSFVTLIDPVSLKVLVRTKMPVPAQQSDGKSDYTNYAGGYFYLDNLDRPVVTTATKHLITYQLQGSAFVPVEDVDLTPVVGSSDSIQSALPDYSGNKWFITKQGVVGYVEKVTGTLRSTRLPAGEAIGNSFSMGTDGAVYIVSTKAQYRYDIVDGAPAVTWRQEYANTGSQKPGQVSDGSGTTPTLMMNGAYVAIADNGDPESVTVFHAAKQPSGNQTLCTVPVFGKGASATENSLIAVNNSLIVENNYGYSGEKATMGGKTTTPGMARVDVLPDGTCVKRWENTSVSAPTVVPKFSAATGLIYTYSKPARSDKKDPWYWTAVDFRTGKRIYSALVGSGINYNNNYASAYLGPDGSGYVGVIGGLVRIADSR